MYLQEIDVCFRINYGRWLCVFCRCRIRICMFKNFLNHLSITNSKRLVNLFYNNQATIVFTKDQRYNCTTKHISITYHVVKDMVALKKVSVEYISMRDIIAYPISNQRYFLEICQDLRFTKILVFLTFCNDFII